MDVTIACFNVTGLLDPGKRNAVFHFLETINMQITLLQETYSSTRTQYTYLI